MFFKVLFATIAVIIILIFAFYKYAEWSMEKHVMRSIMTTGVQGANPFQQKILIDTIKDDLNPKYVPPPWLVDAYKPTKFWVVFYKIKYID